MIGERKMNVDLSEKNIELDHCVRIALNNNDFLNELLLNLTCKNDVIRSNSFDILQMISETNPKKLYSYWHQLVPLLLSKNRYHQYIGIYLIANLTVVDDLDKFNDVFDEFFGIIKQNSTMSAAHCIKKSSLIVKSKPILEKKITSILLNIENLHKGKQIELVKSSVIEAFNGYFDISSNKKEIINFVKNQCLSESPSTRKNAKEFLKKYE